MILFFKYNEIGNEYGINFNDFLNNMMGEYIDAGIIITQPMSTITEFGFSDDQYSFKQGSNDVHLNERYYAQLVPLIHRHSC